MNELFINIIFFFILISLGVIFIYWSMRGDAPPVEKAPQMPPLQPPVHPPCNRPCIFSIKDAKLRKEAKQYVGNAMLVLLRSRDIGLEPGFMDYMYNWLQESIDTTRAALISLSLLKDRGFIKHNQDSILNFVNRCFDETQGGYSIVPKGKATIYGTSNAIEVIKLALDIPRKEELIDNGNTNGFLEKIIKWRDTKLNEFVKSCIKSKDDNIHYVYDEPGDDKTDGICVIYLLSRLLWSLDRKSELFKLIPKPDIESYIRSCKRSIDADGSALGFAPSPSQEKPTMSATSFALLLMGDEPYKEELTELRNEFFDEKKRHEISKFIDKCWDNQRGGFGASEGKPSSTNGTYFALRIRKLLGLKNEEDEIERIKKFVRECYCNGGGFAFSKDFLPKIPFAHGTRWALQIDEEFSEKNGGSLTKVLSKENGGILIKEPSKKDGGILTNEQREETKDFLIYKLYNQEEGGFLGLPIPPDVRAKNCPLINKNMLPLS